MEVIVKLLKTEPRSYPDAHPSYDPEANELVILDIDMGMVAIYNLDEVESITWLLR